MYAKITKDHLFREEYDNPEFNRVDTTFGNDTGEPLLKVRMFDDDGILYYEAVADDDMLEILFDWAQKDAGVTLLQVKNGNKWEDCIG